MDGQVRAFLRQRLIDPVGTRNQVRTQHLQVGGKGIRSLQGLRLKRPNQPVTLFLGRRRFLRVRGSSLFLGARFLALVGAIVFRHGTPPWLEKKNYLLSSCFEFGSVLRLRLV